MGEIFVPVNEELFATLPIGTPEFPFAKFQDNLSNFSKGFVNWHKQEQIEISYVTEGAVRACLLTEEYLIKEGEFFLILPDAFHSVLPVDNHTGKYETIIFDPVLITGFSGSFLEKERYLPVVKSSKKIYTFSDTVCNHALVCLLLEIFKLSTADSCAQKLKLQQNLQQLWIQLYENIFELDTLENRSLHDLRILEIIDFLHKNYQEKYSLTRLAEHMNISRGECCRHFKKCMRMTISEYLLEYRIGKACELLTDTEKRITDIAHTVGFESTSNFSMLFQKTTGKTPREYRKGSK